ncbi:hypothetical protein Tco_0570768 [Tanacetum coccineum]
MASQDARLSKFEADFKQQQNEMTNKIDTVLKAITDQIAEALPSNTIKNPKLSTSLVLSARSYPTKDPQCSSHIHMVRIYSLTIHPSTVLVSPTMKTKKRFVEKRRTTEKYPIVYKKNGITIHPKKQSESHDDKLEENEEEDKDNQENIHVNPSV